MGITSPFFPDRLVEVDITTVTRSNEENWKVSTHSSSRLEKKLKTGDFVITAETTPPDSASVDTVLDKVAGLNGRIDALNVTDSPGARAHMSPLACAAILARDGYEPILQFTVRDKNRLAIQGEFIGASALGIHNILCLHGDSIDKGDQPEAKPVDDVTSSDMFSMARQLRDDGCFPSGREVSPPPSLFIGAADTPREPDDHFSTQGLRAKIDAGADFFQTQFAYDINVLKRYMERLCRDGITQDAYYIAGIGPLSSARSARWMNENLFGVHVPDFIIERLAAAADPVTEGVEICVELIEGFKEIEGVHGAHIMSPGGEQAIIRVLDRLNQKVERL